MRPTRKCFYVTLISEYRLEKSFNYGNEKSPQISEKMTVTFTVLKIFLNKSWRDGFVSIHPCQVSD